MPPSSSIEAFLTHKLSLLLEQRNRVGKMVDLGIDIRSKKRTIEQYNVQALQLENQMS